MEYGEALAQKIDTLFAANNKNDAFREHLGASVLGKKCLREVWFIFRWMDYENFEGRMLRLFNRGHNSESGFAELIKSTGAKVWTIDAKGKQFTVAAFNGHVGGSMDGVAQGLPDLNPDEPVLLEMKTHNGKSFSELKRKGLRVSKPTHYRQAQLYMHLSGLRRCLYCAVNKNDDTLFFYLFDYDPSTGIHLLNRAETVIFGQGLPPRISEDPSWFECRFCAMRGVCFGYSRPQVNCRTCKFSKPERDGSWSCALQHPEIVTQPKLGCLEYRPLI